ncbi:hypothetical protein V7147_11910 [Bacillus sp. JJ1521]|uniref:hypothetical protein n=1 Tax=Bacillus sp. JJ1521 TaxID=3122957 RepID=UPI002FFE8E6C
MFDMEKIGGQFTQMNWDSANGFIFYGKGGENMVTYQQTEVVPRRIPHKQQRLDHDWDPTEFHTKKPKVYREKYRKNLRIALIFYRDNNCCVIKKLFTDKRNTPSYIAYRKLFRKRKFFTNRKGCNI